MWGGQNFLGSLRGARIFSWVHWGVAEYFHEVKGGAEFFFRAFGAIFPFLFMRMGWVFDTKRGDQNFFHFVRGGGIFLRLYGGTSFFLPQSEAGPRKIGYAPSCKNDTSLKGIKTL